MTHRNAGFSLIEVLVAIVILSIGLLALAQTSGTVSRMIGRGKQDTAASLVAQRRLETLRQTAASTTPKCTSLAGGSASGANGSTESWTVAVSGSGDSRDVAVTVDYRIGRGTRTVVIQSVLGCL